MRDEERANRTFCAVPEYYIEIALAFLSKTKAFAGDRKLTGRIVVLLRELIEVRRGKVVDSFKKLTEWVPTEINVTNMSAAEITCFRTRSLHTMDTFLDLLAARQVGKKLDEEGNTQSEGALESSSGLVGDSSSRMVGNDSSSGLAGDSSGPPADTDSSSRLE